MVRVSVRGRGRIRVRIRMLYPPLLFFYVIRFEFRPIFQRNLFEPETGFGSRLGLECRLWLGFRVSGRIRVGVGISLELGLGVRIRIRMRVRVKIWVWVLVCVMVQGQGRVTVTFIVAIFKSSEN
jgi:hypothetical protein